MEVIHEVPGVVKTTFEADTKCIVVYWDNLSDGDIVKTSCLAQAEKVKSGEAKAVIVETSKSKGVPPQDVQDWFASDLFPVFKEANLKALITVIPESALTKLASKKWMTLGSPFNFEIFEAASLEDARTIAAEKIG